ADYEKTEGGIRPIGVTADGHNLIIGSHGGEDHGALYTFDPKAKKVLDLAFRHPTADVSDAIFTSDHQLLGAICEAERPEVYWFDPNHTAWQQAVDKNLTNPLNRLVSSSREGSKAIFLAANDRTPGAYYLLNTATMRLKKLFELGEWIHPEEMAEMTSIQY